MYTYVCSYMCIYIYIHIYIYIYVYQYMYVYIYIYTSYTYTHIWGAQRDTVLIKGNTPKSSYQYSHVCLWICCVCSYAHVNIVVIFAFWS